jgi:hypothetical protein
VGKGAFSKESEKVTSTCTLVINQEIEVDLNIGFFAPIDTVNSTKLFVKRVQKKSLALIGLQGRTQQIRFASKWYGSIDLG